MGQIPPPEQPHWGYSTRLVYRIKFDLKDQAAWTELFTRYEARLRSWARAVREADLDDAVQEAMIKLCKEIDKFDRSRGGFHAWFQVMVKRCAIDLSRKSRAQRKKGDAVGGDGAWFEGVAADDLPPDQELLLQMERDFELAIYQEAKTLVKARFQPSHFRAYELRVEQKLPLDHVARTAGIPLNDATSRIIHKIKATIDAERVRLRHEGPRRTEGQT